MKNVILLVVDSLMPSETGFGGKKPTTTPEIDFLAKTGWLCKNAFSMGNPTEFALPGLFSSSYLLDNGGIENGISNRQFTLAEILKYEGYNTAAFFPIYRPFSFGYDRGFNEFYNLYDPNVIGKNYLNSWKYYSESYHNSEINKQCYVEEMQKVCNDYFNDILDYCLKLQSFEFKSIIPKSLIFDKIDYKSLENNIKQEKKVFDQNPIEYINRMFAGEKLGPMPHIEQVVQKRIKETPTSIIDWKFRIEYLRNVFPIVMASTTKNSAKESFASVIYRLIKGEHFITKYPSGGFILKTFQNWFESQNKKKPFYAYLHLLDAHEFNHYSYDLPNEQVKKKNEYQLIKKAFQNIKKYPNYKGNILYHSSLKYVDHIIKQLRDFLKNKNVLDDTLLIITSDHGAVYPGIPSREKDGHRVDCFFDELYHIPLIFSGGNQKGEYTNLVSSVDIPPTILKQLGVTIPKSFKGVDIAGKNIREYVTMENQGRGPSDLENKNIKICVRTKNMKLVYETPSIHQNARGRIMEIYDLAIDPSEKINLANDCKTVKSAKYLVKKAKKRYQQILDDYLSMKNSLTSGVLQTK